MTIIEQARKIRANMNTVTSTLSDEQGVELIALFEPWQSGTAYAISDRRRYGDKLYKCVQAHTAQDNWTPDQTPALWTVISIEEYPLWVQPTGAQDAYQTGDKVTFEGERYISLINNNTWSPSAYPAGWKIV